MKAYNKIILLCICAAVISACDKSKKYSNRLDGNKWKVTEMTVDGTDDPNKPFLRFSDCDIYEESCTGNWTNSDGGHAHIAWQFRNNGEELEFSNQSDHAHNINDVRSVEQCINYTGVYEVMKSKRKLLSLKSTAAYSFKGKTVIIKLEREN